MSVTLRAAIAGLFALPLLAGGQATTRDSAVVLPRDSATALPLPPASTDSIYRPETFDEYLVGMVGPRPLIRIVALSGFDQWRGRPVAFPSNGRGFGDRLGSRAGQLAISHTLRFGIARAFDERTVKYQLCACGDSLSRFRYALLSPLRVNTPTGRRLSPMYPITEIVSGILVTTVRSDGLHVRDGILNGLTGVAAESATSLVREFWPWHWRPPFL
ncbi:MAG: hypothetical protein JWN53_27 [Gemmatimonadetes bacterium]|nr:hypothetical protein [Gemmatimonadota bacterium]